MNKRKAAMKPYRIFYFIIVLIFFLAGCSSPATPSVPSVTEPGIATKPDQPLHEVTSGKEEASRCVGGTASSNRVRRQAT